MRRYSGDDDSRRIRAFLSEVFILNGRLERSWQVYRFDYWAYFGSRSLLRARLEDVIFLWETTEGRIAAVLNPEENGSVFLQVHPDFRTPALEEEMIEVAELHLPATAKDGGRRLRIWAHEREEARLDILGRRGYVKGEMSEFQRRRALDTPIPDAIVPDDYTIRPLGGDDELPARSWASWKAFHPDEPDEKYEGWRWYRDVQSAPLYRCDLDLVAVAPDESIASFTTVWFDDINRTGAFEPVATVKAHRMKGLAKAVLCEGLRRLRKLGASTAHVGSYEPPAHALYSSVGFVEYDICEQWVKTW